MMWRFTRRHARRKAVAAGAFYLSPTRVTALRGWVWARAFVLLIGAGLGSVGLHVAWLMEKNREHAAAAASLLVTSPARSPRVDPLVAFYDRAQDNPRFVAGLYQAARSVPQAGVYLQRFWQNNGNRFSLRGEAQTEDLALGIVASLQRAGVDARLVELKRQGLGYAFTVDARLPEE